MKYNYVRNKDLIKSLYLYNKHKKNKYENKFFSFITIMINEVIKQGKFIGYTNLHDDMKGNAYFFISRNLKKNNIKIKRLNTGKTCYIKTKLSLDKDKQILNDKSIDINNFDNILGKEVYIKKRSSKDKIIVSKVTKKEKMNARHSKIEYENLEYEINIFMVAFSNIFSYITYIIEQSFWKIINEENFQKNKVQLLYNTFYRSQIDEISPEFDFTNDTNKDKIEKMRLESIRHEKKKIAEMKGYVSKRKKKAVISKNNIFGM
jgi:hypothetical protein